MGIVFLALTDLESPKGDRSLTNGKRVGVKSKGNPNSGIKPVTKPDSSECDKSVRAGEKEKEGEKKMLTSEAKTPNIPGLPSGTLEVGLLLHGSAYSSAGADETTSS